MALVTGAPASLRRRAGCDSRPAALLNDTGEPDPIALSQNQHAVEDLPEESLVFLLGSRYCETDRLTGIAWDLFGNIAHRRPPRPGHLRLRPSPHHLQLPGCPIDENGVGGVRGRQGRVPRLRASGDRLLPLHEHSGSLLHGLSRRHRRSAAATARWISPPGSRPISEGAGTRSMRGTTPRGSAACSSPVDAMRRMWRSATRSVPTLSRVSRSGRTRSGDPLRR